MGSKILIVLMALLLCGGSGGTELQAKTPSAPTKGEIADGAPEVPAGADPSAIDLLVAPLSDEQVRRMLIQELKAAARLEQGGDPGRRDRSLLDQVETASGRAIHRFGTMIAEAPAIPSDLLRAVDLLSGGRGFPRLARLLGLLLGLLGGGWLLERWIWRLTLPFRRRVDTAPAMTGLQRGGVGLLRLLLEMLRLMLFALCSAALFILATGGAAGALRTLFLATLLAAVAGRAAAAFSAVLCAPGQPALRLVPLDDGAANALHRIVTRLGHYIAWAYFAYILVIRLGLGDSTRIFLGLLLTAILIAWLAVLAWRYRDPVGRWIIGRNDHLSSGALWLRQQLAAVWHLLATAYLLSVWLATAIRMLGSEQVHGRGVLLVSVLIVPIYLLLDGIGQWLVSTVLERPAEDFPPAAVGREPDAAAAPPRPFLHWVRSTVRIVILIALTVWLLERYGLKLPFTDMLLRAGFTILVAIAAAQFAWRTISRIINRKLAEISPALPPEGVEFDEEAGAGITTDRSYTLLPVLRKFVATTLLVMVALISLSSLGLDIGPLLAGAGVAGLAIGFGAQKLVHDILSGMFFLVDDAFRVGEYIQVGAADGTVEQISLRNLKLRTPRGTMQLIPFSDIKAVTNFMRGALVEKISLNLPYDTDIETVRKVIKKVGQAMEADLQYGPHIVRPIKSQGVKSVADSVMNFQVKFAANPGKQFIVKREAFRRISQELEKKGIRFAHRKVIVEMPEASPAADAVGTAARARAGAAAAHQTILDREAAASKAADALAKE